MAEKGRSSPWGHVTPHSLGFSKLTIKHTPPQKDFCELGLALTLTNSLLLWLLLQAGSVDISSVLGGARGVLASLWDAWQLMLDEGGDVVFFNGKATK